MHNYEETLKEALANHLIISFIFSIDIKNATEEQIDKLKMTYYNSISFDYKFLLLALLDEGSINDYDVYKMNPNFYRSFNFFNKLIQNILMIRIF